jgi:hypothetical protein
MEHIRDEVPQNLTERLTGGPARRGVVNLSPANALITPKGLGVPLLSPLTLRLSLCFLARSGNAGPSLVDRLGL